MSTVKTFHGKWSARRRPSGLRAIIGTAAVLVIPGALSAAPAQAAIAPARFRIPKAAVAPEIDGRIEDWEWRGATALSGGRYRRPELETRQATFFLQWDEDFIYLAMRSYLLPGVEVKFTDRGSSSDSLELGLFPEQQPRGEDGTGIHYQLFVNDNGGFGFNRINPRNRQSYDDPWRPDVASATQVKDDPEHTYGPGTKIWEIEVRLHRQDFALSRPNAAGDVWRMVLCRNFTTPRVQVHLPVSQGFFNPDGFPAGTLVDDTAVTAGFDRAHGLLRGRVALPLTLRNPTPRPVAVKVDLAVAVRERGPADQARTLPFVPTLRLENTITIPARGAVLYAPDQELPGFTARDVARLAVTVTDDDNETVLSYETGFALDPEFAALAETEPLPQITPQVTMAVYSRFPEGTFLSDGQGLIRRLTFMSGPETHPRLTPDHEAVLLRANHLGPDQWWHVPIAGGEPTLAPAPPPATDGVPSPDGRFTAFERAGNIWLRDNAGRERQLTRDGGVQRFPVWSAEGAGIAYGQSPDGNGPFDIRAIDVAGVGASAPVRNHVDGGFDLVWNCLPLAGSPLPPPVRYEAVGTAAGLTARGVTVRLSAERSTWLAAAEARSHTVVWPRPDAPETLDLMADVIAWIGLDRLGDDFVAPVNTAAPGAEGDLSHYPVVVGLLSGGQALVVVAAPAPDRELRLIRRAGTNVLKVSGGSDVLIIGLLADRHTAWSLDEAPERGGQALWRLAAALPGGSSGFVAGRNEEIARALEERQAVGTSSYVYRFGRTDATPLSQWTVTDVVREGLGCEVGATVLAGTAATSYRLAAHPVAYPTVPLLLTSLKAGLSARWREHARQDVVLWCDDIVGLIAAMDERLAEYRAFATHAAHPALADLLEQGAPEITLAAVAAAAAEVKAGAQDRLAELAQVATAADAERTATLRAARNAVREMRREASRKLASGEDESRPAWRRQYEACGQLLAHRHLVEDDWRGEPVALPLAQEWWNSMF